MPTEIRNIIFSTNEVLFAVKDFRQRKKDPLPSGSILDCKMIEEPKVHVQIEMACDPDGHKRTLTFESEELAAALILFCINRRIPLPADALKILQLFDGELGLVVTMFPPDQKHGKIKAAVEPDKTARLKHAVFPLDPHSP